MTRRDIPCDGCALTGTTCPGTVAHCKAGEHCRDTDASCAASVRYDPCYQCCSCKTSLPAVLLD